MKKKNIWIHIGMVVAMFVLASIYLMPMYEGKTLVQGDQQKATAANYKLRMEAERTGHIPKWEEAMFSGMPSYQIWTDSQKSLFSYVAKAVLMFGTGLSSTVVIIFLYLLGFYIAMILMGVSPWLAMLGAVGFGLGSYNIIIIEAGHATKAWCIAMMAPILAGMTMALKAAIAKDIDKKKRNRQILWGSIVFTVALILQISFNHIQITFYTAIGCLMIGLVYLVYAIVNRRFLPFAASAAILLLGVGLALGCNVRHLLVNQEYAKYTMRGGNEITVTPDDLYHEQSTTASQNTATGLDIDYAYAWSYGVGETYTLLVPGAMGGGSGERVGKESAFYKAFRSEFAPLYWGDQPFTSGPVYFGAVIMLLFLIGMIVTRGPERWWVLAATIIGIILAWGKNFMPFNEWAFYHIPFYNKFRTPSMALVLPSVCVAIMAVLGLKAILEKERDRRRVNLGIYIGTGVLSALILVVLLLSGSFSYSGLSDTQMAAQYGNQWDMIKSVLVSDRMALLRSDSWRSLFLLILTAVVIWLYNNEKLKKSGIVMAIIGVLILVDLWAVDRRYLNEDNFVKSRKLELRPDQWDKDIDELAARYGDYDYRVFNLAVNTFNDSKPSAYHNQVGGYSAAKLSRYQNLIDFYLSRHIKPEVLSMLNTRYVVMQNGQVQRLPDALGNCWFVQEIKPVGNPNEEILALNDIDPAVTAVIDTSKFNVRRSAFGADTTATIALEPQKEESADYRKYVSHSNSDQLAVFSEIHYAPDWFAYIDGKPADYFRANYVLRAMFVPAGDHVIEFKNEAPLFHRLDNIGLIVSIITILLMAGAIILCYAPFRKTETVQS